MTVGGLPSLVYKLLHGRAVTCAIFDLYVGGDMRKPFWKEFALLLFAGSLYASGANAQIGPDGVTFTVSGPFVAGEATLPAGSYKIEQDPIDWGVLRVTDIAGSHSVMVVTELVESDPPRKKTEVIFSKYGSTLVLKQLWLAGNDEGYVVVAGHPEKKAAKTAKPVKQSVAGETKQASSANSKP
jgi:hypothetical protein